jgi:hypothetical protein
MFQCEEAERRRDHRKLDNLYYECLYDILRNADTNGANLPALNRIKAKIVKLHSQRLKSVLLDNVVADIFEEEQPTFYHLTQMQKRRTARTIRSVRDVNGHIQTLPKGISIAFTTHLRTKYDSIDFDDECVRSLAELVRVERQLVYADIIEDPFDPREIYNAIQSGGRNRPPGRDGLGLEFYKANWEILLDLYIILNHMFFGGAITSQQKHGTIFCLPKPHRMLTPSDYRPITLLNTGYNIVARILAHRLRPVLETHLKSTQYCGVPGNNILAAVATVRDAIAHAEQKNVPLCVLALDFKNAFDRISHNYLFTNHHSYDLSSP